MKVRLNRGLAADLCFFRDSHGNEPGMLYKSGAALAGIEIKAADTWHSGFRQALDRFAISAHPLRRKAVVYNGERFLASDGLEALNVENLGAWFATDEPIRDAVASVPTFDEPA